MEQRRRKERQEEASVRTVARSKLSDVQQLAELDIREGKGIGAVKERARLQTRIEAVKSHVEEKKAEAPKAPKKSGNKGKFKKGQNRK